MQSRENSDVLLAYVERTLAPEAAAAFERHAQTCAACREALGAQQAVWAALDGWDAAEIATDFNRRLYQRIEAEERRAWWRRAIGGMFEPVLPWSMRPAMPLAAACMVLVAAFLIRSPGDGEWKAVRGGEVVRGAETRGAETMDVEQVERTLDDLEMLKQLGVGEVRESL